MYRVLSLYCTKNNKINRLHERYLHLIHYDRRSSFQELLEKNISVSIHDSLRALDIEMYKIHYGISTSIINEIFILKHQNKYNLRNWSDFCVSKIRSINHGFESVRYLGHTIYDSDVAGDDCNIIRNDRNRKGGGAASYIRNNIDYNRKACISHNVFTDLLFPKAKPISIGIIYKPQSQT